jgi:hypothetical protein
MNATAISAVVVRRPAVLSGWVSSVTTRVRPWVRLDIALRDRTGCTTLRFLGRTHVPGIVVGCHLRVEGTPCRHGEDLVILNPLYVFVGQDDQPVCTLRNGRYNEFQSWD